MHQKYLHPIIILILFQALTPLSALPSCLFLLPQRPAPYIWPSASSESEGRAGVGSNLVNQEKVGKCLDQTQLSK